MKKYLAMLLSCVMLVGTLTGCGGSTQTSGSASDDGASKDDKLKVTLIVRTALGDKSFYDSAWSGIQRAEKELGVEIKAIEIGGDQSKYEPTVIEASESDADLIFVNSGALSEITEELAPQYPDKKYVFYDMQPTYENTNDNVVALSFKQNESSFLAGIVGAMMSQKGQIGFIGGVENVIINDFMVGYIHGAKTINENIKISTSLVGSNSDSAKAKEMALVQANGGADVIHAVAGAAGLGVLDAVKEKGIWGLGVDSDQAMNLKESAPETADRILTSALKDVGTALFEAIKSYTEGTIEFGTVTCMGVNEGVAGIAKTEYYQKNVPDDIKQVVEEYETQIKNGDLKVMTSFDMTQEEISELKNSVKP